MALFRSFFFKFIYLWLCWVFVSVRELSLVVASGGHSSSWCARHASHYRGLSCCGAQAQTRRLSNCGSRAQLLQGTWDLPRPGLEPMSPALAGRLSTTAPPGKPSFFFYGGVVYHCIYVPHLYPFIPLYIRTTSLSIHLSTDI